MKSTFLETQHKKKRNYLLKQKNNIRQKKYLLRPQELSREKTCSQTKKTENCQTITSAKIITFNILSKDWDHQYFNNKLILNTNISTNPFIEFF